MLITLFQGFTLANGAAKKTENKSNKCNGKSMLLVNGDNGLGDRCDFYLDIYNVSSAVDIDDCRKILTPKKKSPFCLGFSTYYKKNFGKASKSNFEKSFKETVLSGEKQSLVYITDHGSKKKLTKQLKGNFFDNKFKRQSYSSMGADELSENDLRDLIQKTREEQTQNICKCTNCPCDLPPLMMNFDHCYSGGMLNALFDQSGNPMNNVCGISAAGPNEIAYGTETIGLKLTILKNGLKGPFRFMFKKYDLNNDKKISMKELASYMNLKLKESTPLLSSQKFLLNLHEKNKYEIRPKNLFSGFNIKSCYPNISDKADILYLEQRQITFLLEKETTLKNINALYGKKIKKIGKSAIYVLMDEEEKAKKLMKLMSDEERFIKMISKNAYDTLMDGPYRPLKDARRKLLYAEIEKGGIENSICDNNQTCKTFQDKGIELFNYLDQSRSKKHKANIKKEIKKYEKKRLKAFQAIINNEECDQKCKKYKEKQEQFQKAEANLEQVKKTISKDRDSIAKQNKIIINKSIEKIKDLVGPYQDYKLNKVLNQLENKFAEVSTKELFYKDPVKLQKELDKFQEPIGQRIKKIHRKKHKGRVMGRKVSTQIKILNAKRQLILNQDFEKLKQLEQLETCESTELFSY